jgi:hypothetical protein
VISCGEVECGCAGPQPGAGWPTEQDRVQAVAS